MVVAITTDVATTEFSEATAVSGLFCYCSSVMEMAGETVVVTAVVMDAAMVAVTACLAATMEMTVANG
jgi:hypothetical protein